MLTAYTGVLNALEVLDELAIIAMESHSYIPEQAGEPSPGRPCGRWQCRDCGLPLMHDSHHVPGRPRWFLNFERAAESELDDRLLEYKNDRAERARIHAAFIDEWADCGKLPAAKQLIEEIAERSKEGPL